MKQIREKYNRKHKYICIQHKKMQHENTTQKNTTHKQLHSFIFSYTFTLVLYFVDWESLQWCSFCALVIFSNFIEKCNHIIFSFIISVLLWWFILFFKFTFLSDKLISLLCSPYCLSQVHSESKQICFSSGVCCNSSQIIFCQLSIVLWFFGWN